MVEFGRFIYRDTSFQCDYIYFLSDSQNHVRPSRPSENTSEKYFSVHNVLSVSVCCFFYTILPCTIITYYSLCPLLSRSSLKALSSPITGTNTPDKMLACFVSWEHSSSVCKTIKYIYWLKGKRVNFSLSTQQLQCCYIYDCSKESMMLLLGILYQRYCHIKDRYFC